MLQQSLLMFGDALIGKVFGVLRRRAFFARCDFRFGSPRQPTCRGLESPIPAVASGRCSMPLLVPPSSGVRLRSAHLELVGLLDAWPGGRRMQPSLALIERALDRDGGTGLDLVSPCVLAHAAASLDFLDPVRVGPGLVELRRHMGLLLRRRHGGESTPTEESSDRASDGQRSFEDSLTELIELDALTGDFQS